MKDCVVFILAIILGLFLVVLTSKRNSKGGNIRFYGYGGFKKGDKVVVATPFIADTNQGTQLTPGLGPGTVTKVLTATAYNPVGTIQIDFPTLRNFAYVNPDNFDKLKLAAADPDPEPKPPAPRAAPDAQYSVGDTVYAERNFRITAKGKPPVPVPKGTKGRVIGVFWNNIDVDFPDGDGNYSKVGIPPNQRYLLSRPHPPGAAAAATSTDEDSIKKLMEMQGEVTDASRDAEEFADKAGREANTVEETREYLGKGRKKLIEANREMEKMGSYILTLKNKDSEKVKEIQRKTLSAYSGATAYFSRVEGEGEVRDQQQAILGELKNLAARSHAALEEAQRINAKIITEGDAGKDITKEAGFAVGELYTSWSDLWNALIKFFVQQVMTAPSEIYEEIRKLFSKIVVNDKIIGKIFFDVREKIKNAIKKQDPGNENFFRFEDLETNIYNAQVMAHKAMFTFLQEFHIKDFIAAASAADKLEEYKDSSRRLLATAHEIDPGDVPEDLRLMVSAGLDRMGKATSFIQDYWEIANRELEVRVESGLYPPAGENPAHPPLPTVSQHDMGLLFTPGLENPDAYVSMMTRQSRRKRKVKLFDTYPE